MGSVKWGRGLGRPGGHTGSGPPAGACGPSPPDRSWVPSRGPRDAPEEASLNICCPCGHGWAAHPGLPAAGRGRQEAQTEEAGNTPSNCTDTPGKMGAHGTQLHPCSWHPQAPPGAGLGALRRPEGEERGLPCGGVRGVAPAPQESRQAQAGANGCAPTSSLGQH